MYRNISNHLHKFQHHFAKIPRRNLEKLHLVLFMKLHIGIKSVKIQAVHRYYWILIAYRTAGKGKFCS